MSGPIDRGTVLISLIKIGFRAFWLLQNIQKILLQHFLQRFSLNKSRMQPNCNYHPSVADTKCICFQRIHLHQFSCTLVAVMLSCYQRHVVRYQSLPQNSKMGLLTRLFEITGHSYPSFSSIRHGGSTGNSLGKLEKKICSNSKKVLLKYFLDVW